MRFRLFRRRLTISSPRMAVRSALPWPLRWALGAVVLGFCAAIGLWAFELGKDLAGLDHGSEQEVRRLKAELADLRQHVSSLREERDKAQSVANTSATLLTAERAAQEQLTLQARQLQAENRSLRDDLGFFEKLIPSAGSANLAIRGLQAELQNGQQLKWQVLVIQAQKNAPEFNGKLELSLSGVQSGRPWSVVLPEGPLGLKFRQYGRLEGVFELPPQTVIKSVSARVMEGTVVRAAQSIKL